MGTRKHEKKKKLLFTTDRDGHHRHDESLSFWKTKNPPNGIEKYFARGEGGKGGEKLENEKRRRKIVAPATGTQLIYNNNKLVTRLNSLQTLLQVVVLKSLTSVNDYLVVGNTHLYFHPNADHIRLLQGIMGFDLLNNTANELKRKVGISYFFVNVF